MIYLDTSAIAKLIREEPESVALHEVLTADDTPPLFTSQLALTEIKRVLHAAGAADRLRRRRQSHLRLSSFLGTASSPCP